MNLFNRTGNFSYFQIVPLLSYQPVVFLVFSNLPKYVMSFGIVGNLISLIIFVQPCLNRKTNSGKLYAFLCLLSLIMIVYNMAGRSLDNFFEFKIDLPRNSQHFIDITLLQYWSWIQVLITFDRFIGVFYPIKGVRIMSKKWILYTIIFGILIFILGVNSPNYIRCSFYMVGNKTFKANDMICNDVAKLTEIVRILMQFVIPYFLMVILDSMVIIRLRTQVVDRQSASNSKSLRFSRNTILIDFIYLVFNLPPIIFNACYFIVSNYPMINFFQLYINMVPMFITIFPYIYLSLQFLVFITFNRIFRYEFIDIAIKCFNTIKNKIF